MTKADDAKALAQRLVATFSLGNVTLSKPLQDVDYDELTGAEMSEPPSLTVRAAPSLRKSSTPANQSTADASEAIRYIAALDWEAAIAANDDIEAGTLPETLDTLEEPSGIAYTVKQVETLPYDSAYKLTLHQ